MRYKDWVITLYKSSIPNAQTGRYDLGIGGDDIVTNLDPKEAALLERLVDNYADAIDWLFQRASEADKDTFRDIILRMSPHTRLGLRFHDVSQDPDL